MKDFWVFYALDTGAYNGGWSSGDAGAARYQKPPAGMGLLVVPEAAILPGGSLDYDAIRAAAGAQIDRGADQLASALVNNTARQMATYAEKEAEARRVLEGDEAGLVFLPAEAEAVGVPIEDLAASVVARADEWRATSARIEAARRKAKASLAAAETVGGIVQAISIDWQTVTSGPAEGA